MILVYAKVYGITEECLIALWITWSTRERLEVCIAPKKTQSVQCIVEHGTNGRAPKSIQSARNTQDYYAMLGV